MHIQLRHTRALTPPLHIHTHTYTHTPTPIHTHPLAACTCIYMYLARISDDATLLRVLCYYI